MTNFKPTLKDPMSPQSEKFEKNFKKSMITTAPNVQLNEIDNMLNEKEQSLKKKIFSLAKMESLVFSDPKLSAVYEDMAENGEEKYGYHYNETIMNMIFNDYVLNSPKYLQKYKMSIPKEKKRRDKSGINQLKKAGEKKMTQSGLPKSQKTEWSTKGDLNSDFKGNEKPTDPMAKHIVTEDDNSVSKVIFLVNETNPEDPDLFAYFPDDVHHGDYRTGYSHVGQHSAVHPDYASESREATPEEYQELKAELENQVGYNLEVLNGMNETTSAGSAGGAAGYVGYAGPSAWSKSGDLSGDFKGKKKSTDPKAKPVSKIITISESEYLTDPSGFEKYIQKLNEETNMDFNNNIKEDMQTMIQNNGTSMSNKAQATGDQSSGVPAGMQATGGMTENEIPNPAQDAANAEYLSPSDKSYDSDAWVDAQKDAEGIDESENLLEELNKELEAFSIHHNKLKIMGEDRKTSSMVLKDRVGGENQKNFKSDLQHSGTKDVIDVEKELMWKDQQTDVPKDPQKLGQDIEKQAIKTAKMKGDEALKNVGDSTNDNGDEIPKRNLTTAEQEEVNLYRQGLHSPVFDNEPSERFEDRMKADMGDEMYDQRQKQIAFKGQAPMYNKDPQPVEDTTSDKVQFNKNQSGWNERVGIDNDKVLKESMITGRYIDALGKRRLTEFRLSEVKELKTPTNTARQTGLFKMSFDGLGNTYMGKTVDNKVVVNEAVSNAMNSHQFYTDGKTFFAIKNPVQKLNENELKNEKTVVNEQVDKMKHLLGYKPNNFVSTSNVKKNRGF